jgi:hypothetical protein
MNFVIFRRVSSVHNILSSVGYPRSLEDLVFKENLWPKDDFILNEYFVLCHQLLLHIVVLNLVNNLATYIVTPPLL